MKTEQVVVTSLTCRGVVVRERGGTHPQHGYTPCAGAQAPRCWDLGLGNRSPNQNLPLPPLSRGQREEAGPDHERILRTSYENFRTYEDVST